jgi:protein-L-isoaspartate(D-aspartate) O-methyltransferase
MKGWIVPPPKDPTKSKREFQGERARKVRQLIKQGYLRSYRIKQAMLKVSREDFIPPGYKDYAYLEVPLPLPGKEATVSCPHSYPLFYEPLGLDRGHKFLEVGLGSGYGAALAREVVGRERGDGGLGYPEFAPYDRICITAACLDVPPPLIAQLGSGGRLIVPIIERGIQNLVLFEKSDGDLRKEIICEVLYVRFKGMYGTD